MYHVYVCILCKAYGIIDDAICEEKKLYTKIQPHKESWVCNEKQNIKV